jgi:AbiJ N-terminal domain 5
MDVRLDSASRQRLLEAARIASATFSESDWRELSLLTNCYDLVDNHPRLLRSLSFMDPDYHGHVIAVLQKMGEAGPENVNIIERFVARDGTNISSVPTGQQIVFSPSVFEVPSARVESRLVSVMMPFEATFRPVYEAIKENLTEQGFQCLRADNIWEHSVVIQDIFSLIFRSFIVVCDFSGRNPNVFYEAGIAHTLGKHVIPITQNPADIPFDLQHHRYIKYLNNGEGRAELVNNLARRVAQLT